MEVLIIGLGSIAAKHIIALKAIDKDVKIYALRSGKGNDTEGIINIYDLSELISKPRFVIISNPTQLHQQSILFVIKLGVPLFIEKPPLHTLSGAQEIVEQINQHNIFTYVACNLRFHPCIQFLKDHLKNNNRHINEVNVYCGSYLPDWRPGKDYKTAYSANKDLGGGVHLDLFHETDYTCWLFGYPGTSRGFISNKSSLKIDAADYANYLLEYPGFNASIILNYYRKSPKRTIDILFDTESWTVDLISNTIVADSNKLIFQSPDFKIIDTYINQMRYFVDYQEAKKIPMNTFEEAIETLKISLKNE
ncbi:Gfo/Idh/MocA family oxidoreductase [Mucilaginibacter sp.]|uniref:Gfo/Idh/MocA family protein n=1 Tax=Mucilaginibacter sp. TaxID=1882438 RepID=UPI00260BBC93|nr:Gfo/Idh/MocA family oxidoreductase [Mucilaginibacter sp.]MDB4921089.1 putative dehydrogenase [Mucilaginibacter sp.]